MINEAWDNGMCSRKRIHATTVMKKDLGEHNSFYQKTCSICCKQKDGKKRPRKAYNGFTTPQVLVSSILLFSQSYD